MKIIGLDLSVAKFGLAVLDRDEAENDARFPEQRLVDFLWASTEVSKTDGQHIKTQTYLKKQAGAKKEKFVPFEFAVKAASNFSFQMRRTQILYSQIVETLREHQPAVVAMESYAPAQGTDFMAAELGGLIRMWLWMRKIPLTWYPPSSLKALFAGSGQADKDAMVNSAELIWDMDLRDICGKKPAEDVADALAVAYALHTVLSLKCRSGLLKTLTQTAQRTLQRISKDGCNLMTRPFVVQPTGRRI